MRTLSEVAIEEGRRTPPLLPARRPIRAQRSIRVLGGVLVAAGVLVLAWVLLVWRWQDPFTGLYAHVQQQRLADAYEQRAGVRSPATGDVLREAVRYRRSLRVGDPVGRIEIDRIGLHMVVVQGTDHDTLKRGPGHEVSTRLPGEGGLTYVAGHRTTYLAPFARIDALRRGDSITFSLPYATFTYVVTRHYVVGERNVRVLRDTPLEVLRLQACHPRFFATHRYIVDAELADVAT